MSYPARRGERPGASADRWRQALERLEEDPFTSAPPAATAPLVSAVDTVYRTRQDRSIVDLLSSNNTANRSLIFGFPSTSGRVPYRRAALSMRSGAIG